MYKIWHRLFGWDYVAVSFAVGMVICRVIVAPNGKEYIELYGDKLFLEDKIVHRRFKHLTKREEKE